MTRGQARSETSAARVRREPERAAEPRRQAPVDALARLQQTVGNAAVEAALRSAGVRLHADGGADELLRDRSALALTRGRDVYLSPTLDLAGERGRRVLAHELAHVVQQTRPERETAPAALEAEAQAIGAGAEAEVVGGAAFGALQAWSLFGDDEEEQARERQQRDKEAEAQVERLELLKSTVAWKDYVDHPLIGPWLRAHPGRLDPLNQNTEFQNWVEDPQRNRPAPPPRVEPPAAEASPPGTTRSQPSEAGLTATITPPKVDVTYDEAAGQYVLTAEGTPVAAIRAKRGTQLDVNVVMSGDRLDLAVSGGPHEVVPLGPQRPGAGPATVPVYSETASLVPADARPTKSLEQIARENWEQSTSPRQKWEAALRGPPERYIGSYERSLLEFEHGMKMLPGVRAGVSFGQAYWEEDIIGRPVSRSAAIKQGLTEFGEDLSMVLEPEDLMELGSGRAGAALEEGATMTSELGASGGREGLAGKPPSGERPRRVAHGDIDRVTYTDVESAPTTKGNVSSPKYQPGPPKPAKAPAPTKKQLRALSLNEGYTARPKGISADLDPTLARVKEEGLGMRSWKEQGREFRSETLETFAYDKNQPAHVRGWLENEQRRVALREAEGAGARSSLSPAERSRRLKLGHDPSQIRNPPGYVLGHGSSTPAREGFGYSSSTLTTEDLNKLEEFWAKRRRYRR
jgi:hypothetical protein